jgi:hypothetical protein
MVVGLTNKTVRDVYFNSIFNIISVAPTVVEYERFLSRKFDGEIRGGWFHVPGSVVEKY